MSGQTHAHDPLEPQHRRELEVDSAIPAELIAEEQIRTLGHVLELDDVTPDPSFRHPDPEKARRFGTRPPVDCGGILFPIESWTTGELTWQFKPDRPRLRDGKPVKYESPPGARLTLYAPRRIRRKLARLDIPLWITEGVKKTLSAVGQGLCCIGLAGVDAWSVKLGEYLSSVLPELAAIPLDGRLVFIAFDSDAAQKPSVRGAIERLKHELEARGARVVVATIPPGPGGSKQGLDDFIANGGDVSALAGAAIVSALDAARAACPPTDDDACRREGHVEQIAALKERIKEHEAGDELVRNGPFTPSEALVAKHLVTIASAANDNGKEKLPLLREDVARESLGSDSLANIKTVSRAFKAIKGLQDDPTAAVKLPYRLDWRAGGSKDHVDLYPTRKLQTKAQEYMTLREIPGRKPPTRVSEHPSGCRRCNSPHGVERRGVYRCLNDACGHTWHSRAVVLGREDVATLAPPAATSLLVDTLPGQIVPAHPVNTYAGQIVPANADDAPRYAVSFVSRDEQLAAKMTPYVVLSETDDADELFVELADGRSQELPPPIYPPELDGTDRVCDAHGIPRLASGRCSMCASPPKAPPPARPLVTHDVAPPGDFTRFGRRWRTQELSS